MQDQTQKSQISSVPQQAPTWFHPDYPPLSSTDDIGKAAVNGQVVEYPQVVRTNVDPPIIGQHFGNVSFMLFKEPRIFRGKPIYGYVKLRGNHNDDKTARFDSYRIVREIDSKFQIRIAPVGAWVPITDSDSVVKDLYDVKEDGEHKNLRDEASKEKQAEEKRKIREIKEAEEKLKEGGDVYDRPESLDFYSMKRVTEMRLVENLDAAKRKVKEIEESMIETHILLHILENEHPEYCDEWLDHYNSERSKTSLPEYVPGENTFAYYEASSLTELSEKYPEILDKVMKNLKTYGDDGKNVKKKSQTLSESILSDKKEKRVITPKKGLLNRKTSGPELVPTTNSVNLTSTTDTTTTQK